MTLPSNNLGIDATNIRSGGGLTHLIELLSNIDSSSLPFSYIHVWCTSSTSRFLPTRSWLIVHTLKYNNTFYRVFWHIFILGYIARSFNCSVLFFPGSFNLSYFPVSAVLSQNMLPFDFQQIKLYSFSFQFIRLYILRIIQAFSFMRSTSTIFLSSGARTRILKCIPFEPRTTCVIPHGVSTPFFKSTHSSYPLSCFSRLRPFKIIYVSTIDVYKNHLNVIKAIDYLIREFSYPISLNFVGSAYPPCLSRIKAYLRDSVSEDFSLNILGHLDPSQLVLSLENCDLGIFASSCENLPITMLENMASGIPLVCSNIPPMSDLVYPLQIVFDPSDYLSIASSIRTLIEDLPLRKSISKELYSRSLPFRWHTSSMKTISHLFSLVS